MSFELAPVNIRESVVFCRSHDMFPSLMQRYQIEGIHTILLNMMTEKAVVFAEQHPDFPAQLETKAARCLGVEPGSEEWYEYLPFKEQYGRADDEALEASGTAFVEWASDHPEDSMALTIAAAYEALINSVFLYNGGDDVSFDRVNTFLLQTLHNEAAGQTLDVGLWIPTSGLADFEGWYKRTFNDV